MSQTKQYSAHVHEAIHSLQMYVQMDPFAYKTVEDLWNVHAGYSRSMIEKAFKHVTGYRIKQYLCITKLEHSKKFLRAGMPIKQISDKLRYTSHSAYTSAFKKFMNETPKDYINNLKK